MRHVDGVVFQINLSHALFRRARIHDEYDDIPPILEPPWKAKRRQHLDSTTKLFSSLDSSLLSTSSDPDPDSVISSLMRDPPEQRCFYLEELGDCLKLPAEVARVSTCELELDAVAADILNHHDLTGAAMNPGLVALWEDERIRREREGVEDPLTDPPSPPRPESVRERNETEQFW